MCVINQLTPPKNIFALKNNQKQNNKNHIHLCYISLEGFTLIFWFRVYWLLIPEQLALEKSRNQNMGISTDVYLTYLKTNTEFLYQAKYCSLN